MGATHRPLHRTRDRSVRRHTLSAMGHRIRLQTPWVWLLFGLVVACARDDAGVPAHGAVAEPIPLGQAVLGDWTARCRTETKAQMRCLGQSPLRDRMSVKAGGAVLTQFDDNDPLTGTWTLDVDVLTLSFDIHGTHVDESHLVRVDDGRLRLWSVGSGFGTVYVRPDATFVPPPTQVAVTSPVASSVGGVGYSLHVPAGYRLARDEDLRQRWDPPDGEGLLFQVRAGSRPQVHREGGAVTEPCAPLQRPLSVGSSSQQRTGEPEMLTAVSTDICVAGTNLSLTCRAIHRRGHILPPERVRAETVCRTLALAESSAAR